ncbi:MAG: hypothetical protein WCE61_22175 [Candidatus Acidiferrum sp.]
MMRPREAKPFTRLRGFELCECSESVIVVDRFTAHAFRIPKSEMNFCSMCGPLSCSTKITEDVRKYAADRNWSTRRRSQEVLTAKSEEFTNQGFELYAKV